MGTKQFVGRQYRAVIDSRLSVFAIGVMVGVSLLAIVVLLCSCNAFTRWQARQDHDAFVRQLTYHRDPKTGLCFVVRDGGSGGIAVVDGKYCKQVKP